MEFTINENGVVLADDDDRIFMYKFEAGKRTALIVRE